MWPAIIAAAPAIIAAASALGGSLLQKQGQEDANSANAHQADMQMQFQERMSNTAHQREVEDLRKAGLNPILSANAGASSPGGAMAVYRNTYEDAARNAVAANSAYASIKLMNEQAKTEQYKQNIMGAQAVETLFNAKQAENIFNLSNTINETLIEYYKSSPGKFGLKAGASAKDYGAWVDRLLDAYSTVKSANRSPGRGMVINNW